MSRQPSLIRSLKLPDTTLLIIGCIVGVGIFRSASSIAAEVPSPTLILLLWILGGVISLCGGLCYAELAAMFPVSGGDYVYIREIYGKVWGFLFGWTKLFVERTGTIAILGVVFAEYLSLALPWIAPITRPIAVIAILFLTAINIRGIQWGKFVQNTFTLIKIGALAAIAVAGLSAAFQGNVPTTTSWSLPPVDFSLIQSMGVAFVFVIWTYGGWTEAGYVAEEIQKPTRNIPLSIMIGVALTTTLYLFVNWSYLRFVPMERLPHTPMVASTVMEGVIGPAGAIFIAIMVACSAFGALNGYILTGARILYALGKDYALFSRLGGVHQRYHTPALALWVNAFLAAALVFTKTFEQIVTYSTVIISVFFVMAVAGIFILRRREPQRSRPYRVWGYPVTPAIFLLTMIGFILNMCFREPAEAAFGFGLFALGLPLYWLSNRIKHQTDL